MNGRIVWGVQKINISRCHRSSLFLRHAHTRPTGQPLFSKKQSLEDSVAPALIAFGTAFALTVGTLYFTTSNQSISHGLRPIQYGEFEVLEARKARSPSTNDGGDSEHVYLKVNAPLGKEAAWINAQLLRSSDVRILSIFMKEPSLQIERPYTPLYADAIDGTQPSAPIELLIKEYPDGELGKYAHRLRERAQVEFRGPDVTWQGPRVDQFVFIVGGTGITPAYQLLNTLISQSSRLGKPLPEFHLLYAANKPSSLLLLPELAELQREFPQQIDIRLHVDQHDKLTKQTLSWTNWILSRPARLEDLEVRVGKIDEKAVRAALESSSEGKASRRILVCGPEGMVSYVAGPKQGKLQGNLGGILASLSCKEEEVWKL